MLIYLKQFLPCLKKKGNLANFTFLFSQSVCLAHYYNIQCTLESAKDRSLKFYEVQSKTSWTIFMNNVLITSVS